MRFVFISTLALLLAFASGNAQDKITTKVGQTQSGKIMEVSNGNAQINIGAGTIGIRLADIASVEMAIPVEVKLAQNAPPDRIVSLLLPLVQKFKGLPADWVVNAMGSVAEAYSTLGRSTEASNLNQEMVKLYPGSRYLIKANVGLAKSALQGKKYDEALKLLQPLIQEANKKVFPQVNEAKLYAEAFYTQGEAQEAKGDLVSALESYLTVVTSFYHNAELAGRAQQKAETLRKNNPTLAVR